MTEQAQTAADKEANVIEDAMSLSIDEIDSVVARGLADPGTTDTEHYLLRTIGLLLIRVILAECKAADA